MVRRAAQLVCCKPCAGNGNPLNQRGLDHLGPFGLSHVT